MDDEIVRIVRQLGARREVIDDQIASLERERRRIAAAIKALEAVDSVEAPEDKPRKRKEPVVASDAQPKQLRGRHPKACHCPKHASTAPKPLVASAAAATVKPLVTIHAKEPIKTKTAKALRAVASAAAATLSTNGHANANGNGAQRASEHVSISATPPAKTLKGLCGMLFRNGGMPMDRICVRLALDLSAATALVHEGEKQHLIKRQFRESGDRFEYVGGANVIEAAPNV